MKRRRLRRQEWQRCGTHIEWRDRRAVAPTTPPPNIPWRRGEGLTSPLATAPQSSSPRHSHCAGGRRRTSRSFSYLLLVLTGFRGALIAALAWSYLALGRRLLKGEPVSMLLLFGTILISLRTVIAFVTGSAFLYFAQPTAGTVAISVALFVSAVVGRPFTQRFAHDFCPMDATIMKRPLVRRFFIRISFLWASVLMLNAGLVFWLLVSSSLRAFVLERTLVTYSTDSHP